MGLFQYSCLNHETGATDRFEAVALRDEGPGYIIIETAGQERHAVRNVPIEALNAFADAVASKGQAKALDLKDGGQIKMGQVYRGEFTATHGTFDDFVASHLTAD